MYSVSCKFEAQMDSESVLNKGKKIAFLKNISPGTFEFKGSDVVCLYCIGNSCTINLNPTHGSFKNSVSSHLQLKQYTATAKGTKQGMLDALFLHKVKFVQSPNIKRMK